MHRPIALQIFKETRCVYTEAWKGAMERTSRARAHYPFSYLSELLEGSSTLGPSSSGVEQGFSKSVWAINKQQLHADTAHLES